MPSVDERVVAMSYETAKFDAGVQKTLAGLKTLSDALNNISKLQGLEQLEASANKVTLAAPMSALDRLKSKLGFTTAGSTFSDMESAADKQVTMNGPMSALDRLKAKLGMTNAGTTFSDMEKASTGVTMSAPMSALDKLKAKFGLTNAGATFSDMERDSNRVTLNAPMSALDKLKIKLGMTNAGSAFSDMERASSNVTLTAPMSALDKLKAKFGSVDVGTTFSDMERASGAVTFRPLHSSIDSVESKFSELTIIATASLTALTMDVTRKARAIANSLTLEPVMAGFHNYETQINAVQTILANTGLTGQAGLDKVTGALDNLNDYANKTVYNFSEMAKNIGTFTAAGVKLGPATESIKGIANLAALSGSSSQQASTAMYQLSQAIAAGKVNLQDWNSVVNAGMGGQVFQKALWNSAKAMGTLKDVPVGETFEEWKAKGNSFRQSLSATQKSATDGAGAIAKAQKDAAESVASAQESAAESIQNAKDRITDAQKRVADVHESTAEAVKSASTRVKEAEDNVAEAAKQSGEAIKAAKDKVKEAHQNVADVAKQSTENIAAAVKSQEDSLKQSAESVAAALDGVTDAQKRLADAMKPASADDLGAATDRLTTAQLDQADLADAVTLAQQEQTRATEDLATAQKNLAAAKASGDASAIQSAQRAVQDATKRSSDASDAQTRAAIRQRDATRDVNKATQDLTDTQNKGSAADQNVQDAQDALTEALKRYQQAQTDASENAISGENQVAQARKDAAEAQKNARKDLIDAEKNVTQTIKDSAKKQKAAAEQVRDAEKALSKTRKDGAEQAREAADAVVDAQKDEVKATQDAQKQIAKAHEQAADQIQAAQEKAHPDAAGPTSWLTSDVLTSTLSQFTGDMTDAQLKAKGFSDAQIKAIQAQAKVAVDSATKIKTVTQLMDALREEVGGAWAQVFKTLFGDINEAKGLFTGIHTVMENALTGPINNFNKVLKEWKKLGGRDDLLAGLKQGFEDLKAILAPFQDAFRDVFPKKTADDLLTMTSRFHDLMKSLEISPETSDNLQRTFAGLFAILDIGWQIIKRVIGVISSLIGEVGKGSGGILGFTGSVGDFLVALDEALKSGASFTGFFKELEFYIKNPLALLELIETTVKKLFGVEDTGRTTDFGNAMGGLGDKLGPLKKVVDIVKSGFEGLKGILGKVKEALQPWFDTLADKFSGVGDVITHVFDGLDYNKITAGLQTGLLAGILVSLKKALGIDTLIKVGDPLKGVNGMLKEFTTTLSSMQTTLHAATLLLIAAAIVALAGGILILSKIPADDLGRAMTAVAVGLGELMGAMKLMTAGMGAMGTVQLIPIALSLIILAGAVTLLAVAMKIFATMSWEDIGKGLAGVAGSLAAVGLGMKLMSGGPFLAAQAASLILIGGALILIGAAMKIFATMKWEDIGKGLFTVVEALAGIALGMSLMPPSLPITAAGLVLVAVALNGIALALKIFASIDLASMIKGIGGMAAALVTIAFAIALMPPTMALQAAGLVIMASALTLMAGAIAVMGNLKVETLVKGLIAMGLALGVLAVGLILMEGTLAGAAGLMAAALALAILAPTLGFLGTMDLKTLVIGLAAIGAAILVIGLTSEIAAPGLIALGIAMVPIGIGLAAIAAAFYLFAAGMSLLAESGQKGLAVFLTALTGFVALLPTIIIKFIKGLLDIVEEVAALAPKVVVALGLVLDTIIAFVTANAAKLATAIGLLVDAFVTVIVENTPKLIDTGYKMLIDFLSGLQNNIGTVTTQVANIIVNFLNAVTAKLPDIIDSGVKLLVAWIGGIASKAGDLVTAVANLIVAFVGAVGDNLSKIVTAGANLIAKFITAIVGGLGTILSKGADAVLHFLSGVATKVTDVIDKGVEIAGKFVSGMAKGLVKLVDTGLQAIIDFLNGLAKTIREHSHELNAAGINVASAIIDGIWDGIQQLGYKVWNKFHELINGLPTIAKKLLGISSPSKVFTEIGENTMAGMVVGFTSMSGAVSSAAGGVADDAITTMQDSLRNIPNMVDGFDVDPTITPVLDLSQVEKDAQKLGDLTNVTPITAASSFGQAAAISAAQAAAASSAADQAAQGGNTFEFKQYNTSPKSLSEIEIYRQTNNQLAQLKSAVGIA